MTFWSFLAQPTKELFDLERAITVANRFDLPGNFFATWICRNLQKIEFSLSGFSRKIQFSNSHCLSSVD
jgi:hypothetical protein